MQGCYYTQEQRPLFSNKVSLQDVSLPKGDLQAASSSYEQQMVLAAASAGSSESLGSTIGDEVTPESMSTTGRPLSDIVSDTRVENARLATSTILSTQDGLPPDVASLNADNRLFVDSREIIPDGYLTLGAYVSTGAPIEELIPFSGADRNILSVVDLVGVEFAFTSATYNGDGLAVYQQSSTSPLQSFTGSATMTIDFANTALSAFNFSDDGRSNGFQLAGGATGLELSGSGEQFFTRDFYIDGSGVFSNLSTSSADFSAEFYDNDAYPELEPAGASAIITHPEFSSTFTFKRQ